MKKTFVALVVLLQFLLSTWNINAQPPGRHTGEFMEYRNHFREELKKRLEEKTEQEKPEREFKMNIEGLDVPKSIDEFKKVWHVAPQSQGLTGSCWAFSSISFLESEIYRRSGQKISLSPMFAVYWEYVEKARRFVKKRGDSRFSKGSQPNALIRVCRKYGAVPHDLYPGRKDNLDFYHTGDMFDEMDNYLESVKQRDAWNEEEVIDTVRSILDHYMGRPPEEITIEGDAMTSKQYLQNMLELDLDEYIDVMSLKEKPWRQKVEYKVPDNWWHSADYYNVPLEDFMKVIKTAVGNGYSICIVGDNSETGFLHYNDAAMIPSYDIPSEFIDDNARQMRFTSGATSDDHAIHMVGYCEKNGKDWFLIKDSGTKSRNGKVKGYMFYHEDYVKLKMMNILVHKQAVEEALGRIDF